MRACRILAWLLISIGAAAAPVRAGQPGRFVTQLIGRSPGPGKTFACFSRIYDDAHLAGHPAQNLRSIRVLAVSYSNLDYAYQLRMGFEFRGHPETLTSVAECGHDEPVGESARCAGPVGGRTMGLSVEGHRSILLNLPDGAHLWKPGPPKPKDTVNDALGPDDKLIRLYRTHLADCADQSLDAEEKALLERDR